MKLSLYRGNFKGLFFIICFRIVNFVSKRRALRIVLFPIWVLYRFIFNWVLGIDISEFATIGENFVLWHGIGVIVHPQTVIGHNVTMRHNTTIGNARSNGGAPIIGNNVNIGANVVILGDIQIGDNVIIGAGSVITKSVPDNVVIVGNPARIVRCL